MVGKTVHVTLRQGRVRVFKLGLSQWKCCVGWVQRARARLHRTSQQLGIYSEKLLREMLSRGITKSHEYTLNKSTLLRNELDLKNCNTKENEFNTFDFDSWWSYCANASKMWGINIYSTVLCGVIKRNQSRDLNVKYGLLWFSPHPLFCHQKEAILLTLIIYRNQNLQGISGRNIPIEVFYKWFKYQVKFLLKQLGVLPFVCHIERHSLLFLQFFFMLLGGKV